MANAIVGANQADTHYLNVDSTRDFSVSQYCDLRLAGEGDACPRCGEELNEYRGIEVGHVFFLGTKYTEAMRCNYLEKW